MFEPAWVEGYKSSSTALSECITRHDYRYKGETGSIYMCNPYDGIFLWVNDVYASQIPTREVEGYHFIKINICLEGHCEALLADGRYVYLEPGIISVDSNQTKGFYRYQTKRYRGIEIVIDLGQLKKMPIQAFTDIGLSAEPLLGILQKKKGSYLGRGDTKWCGLADNLCGHLTAADQEACDYRFALLQLLYKMKHGKITAVDKDIYLTKGQREIAGRAEEILTKDLSQRFSMEELAEQFKISPSSLKKYFELRYGNPVSVYMREKRLEYGKKSLEDTDQNIVEIAGLVGYSSQGKFCGVFKKYVGMTPLEYRRRHTGGEKDEAD